MSMPKLKTTGHTYIYTVGYTLVQHGAYHYVDVIAANKWDAYDKAVYEVIPRVEKRQAYSAWVESVTYRNGSQKRFNTHEGKPV